MITFNIIFLAIFFVLCVVSFIVTMTANENEPTKRYMGALGILVTSMAIGYIINNLTNIFYNI